MREHLDDDQLRAFAEPARMTVWPAADALLQMGDIETLLQVVEQDGDYAVQKQSRGDAWRSQAVTGTLATARRYLIWQIGDWMRSAGRSPGHPPAAEPVRDGFTLVDLGARGLELRWTEPAGPRWIRFPGDDWGRRTAIRFARYADAPEEEIVRRVRTAPENSPTAQQRRLIALGTELFRRIAPESDLTLTFRLLPEDDAVVVVRPVRGGGSIYVAADETVLYAASAMAPHQALEEFRSGRRTPIDRFVAPPAAPSDRASRGGSR